MSAAALPAPASVVSAWAPRRPFLVSALALRRPTRRYTPAWSSSSQPTLPPGPPPMALRGHEPSAPMPAPLGTEAPHRSEIQRAAQREAHGRTMRSPSPPRPLPGRGNKAHRPVAELALSCVRPPLNSNVEGRHICPALHAAQPLTEAPQGARIDSRLGPFGCPQEYGFRSRCGRY